MSEEKRRKVVIEDDEEEDVEQVNEVIDDEVNVNENTEGNEAIDDLFGDDDEDDEAQPEQQDEENQDQDQDQEANSDSDGYAQFEVDPTTTNIQPKELKVGNEDIVRHPPKFNPEDDNKAIYDAKIPKFFKVNPVRFDGNDYLKKLNEEYNNKKGDESDSLKRLIDENTIRWRFIAQESNKTLKIESNSQLIEWDDGSLSLKLGDEIFDVYSGDVQDTYLTTEHVVNDHTKIHLNEGPITKNIKFVPTSTNSKVHKKLTGVLQSRQAVKPGVQNVFVDVDPETETRRLEKLMEDQIREKRRQQLKLDKEQERSGSVGPTGSSSSTLGQSRYGARETYEEGYDDEDGFIDDDVDDDEDVEDVDGDDDDGDDDEDDDEDDDAGNQERLQQIKQAGEQQYEESRKKRRVIMDDDDEE